jgi:aryl-alcohol dehydrogenase-like predicted oxidoreductase
VTRVDRRISPNQTALWTVYELLSLGTTWGPHAMHTREQCAAQRSCRRRTTGRLLERAVEPSARHYGLGVLPYFPLASGLPVGVLCRTAAPYTSAHGAMALPNTRAQQANPETGTPVAHRNPTSPAARHDRSRFR